ncbi:hypothetical protein [Xenorhabdus sp. PB30.3]|uniref:hypothetical protein n=1 Tax=Xenorhabdus sp. PB30.3 TaxID=2788941 RepID=UPI001E347362|nr:hypothetical protein [Xenorhabdus sp. PB30.3]MCC8380341.1 hypothetical protein [Xenorhabdus sp. PB30.3]
MTTSDKFSQVRQAHRICAAFYQYIFPMLNQVTENLGMDFIKWEKWSFKKLSRQSTNPLTTWSWNSLPMMDVSFVFGKKTTNGTILTPEDFVLDLSLIIDHELEYSTRIENYGENVEPDACKLKLNAEESESYIAIYLFSLIKKNKNYTSLEDIWYADEDYPKMDSKIHKSKDVQSIGFKVNLNEIAKDDGAIILLKKINQHLKKLGIKTHKI